MMVDRQHRSHHRIENEQNKHTPHMDDKYQPHHQPLSSLLSIASDHSGDDCCHHHEAFMSASPSTLAHSDDGSCDSHSTHSTHISSVSNLTGHTITKSSNAPKASQPNSRRSSIVNLNGAVLSEPLTVLQLSNSETVDTKDVYVMAVPTISPAANNSAHTTPNTNTTHTHAAAPAKTSPPLPVPLQLQRPKSARPQRTLAVPKWSADDTLESADEYDSEAHGQSDEDVIIKRVMAKFNQQNRQIIRKKVSFVESFQFWQNQEKQEKHKTSNKKSGRKADKNKKEKKHDNSANSTRDTHQRLLINLSEAATLKQAPQSLQKSLQTPIIAHSKNESLDFRASTRTRNHKAKQTASCNHSRQTTPLEDGLGFDLTALQRDIERTQTPTCTRARHTKTMSSMMSTALSIRVDNLAPTASNTFTNLARSSESPSMCAPEPTMTPLAIMSTSSVHMHRKALSVGPQMFSASELNNETQHARTASVIPTMLDCKCSDDDDADDDNNDGSDEDDIYHFLMGIFSDKESALSKSCAHKPELVHSLTSPPILKSAHVSPVNSQCASQSSAQSQLQAQPTISKWDELDLVALNEASDEEDMHSAAGDDEEDDDDMNSVIYNEDREEEEFDDGDGDNDAKHPTLQLDFDGNDNGNTADGHTDVRDRDDPLLLRHNQDIVPSIGSRSRPPQHRRLESAPVHLGWNFEQAFLMEELKSDHSDVSDDDDDDDDEDEEEDSTSKLQLELDTADDPLAFGTQRIFVTFAKELAITHEAPKALFEVLLEICVSLRSQNGTRIPFDSHWLQHSSTDTGRIVSFLKLLGFKADEEHNAYVLASPSKGGSRRGRRVDTDCVEYAMAACQQQLIELSSKSSLYDAIVHSRTMRRDSTSMSAAQRSRAGSSTILSPQSMLMAPPPPPQIREDKSDQIVHGEVALPPARSGSIDADRCQLYELIWTCTHAQHSDQKSKEAMMLCYPMVTSALKFIKLLEARFFNDDHGRASCSSSEYQYGSMTPSPSIPSSLINCAPSPSMASPNNCTITFDYARIQSSYMVQRKVVQIIIAWMQKFWVDDWHAKQALLAFLDAFMDKIRNAYLNDIEYDEQERAKGLELMQMVQKTMQTQRAEQVLNTTNATYLETLASRPPLTSALSLNVFTAKAGKPRAQSTRHRSISSNPRGMPVALSPRSSNDTAGRHRLQSFHRHSRRKISFLSGSHKNVVSAEDAWMTPIPTDLLKVNNEALAHQMAVLLFAEFAAIKPRECLYQYSMKSGDSAAAADNAWPNIKAYKDTFNDIVKWVQSSILLQEQVAKRARMIKKWIKVADLLFIIRCFQGFVAVQCALSSNAVFSLKDAWNQTSVLKRKHHTKFREIKVIMSASHNFENFRRLQREAHPPLVPYFGIFCKDLVAMQEGMTKRNQDGMINWGKLWRISELIKEHLSYQAMPYNRMIEADPSMQEWLCTELKRCNMLKSEHLEKMSRDVAQGDKHKKLKRHQKSFTMKL